MAAVSTSASASETLEGALSMSICAGRGCWDVCCLLFFGAWLLALGSGFHRCAFVYLLLPLLALSLYPRLSVHSPLLYLSHVLVSPSISIPIRILAISFLLTYLDVFYWSRITRSFIP